MRKLTAVLEAVQRLVDRRDDVDDDVDCESVDQAETGAILHLLRVKSSSAVYTVAAPDQDGALTVLREVNSAIHEPESSDWLDSTLSSVKEISEVARSLGCEIEFREPQDRRKLGNVIVRITPATYSDIEGSAYVTAPTAVYANIERVGGATDMHCGIRLPSHPRKMVICRVKTAELVRELGQYMYQDVVLHGQATWLRHNWRLKRLVVDSFEPPKTGSILDALRASHKAGGSAWDAVDDPERLIMEMRGA